jgi:6-pyruvoyltetrahydropterin/6-carboxytetrahydropterin synthase
MPWRSLPSGRTRDYGMSVRAVRYHDISCGHRVVGHEGKCQNLHGHNYRITFTVEAKDELGDCDKVGRVLDFSVIKEKLCVWLEREWDHKMLIWSEDPLYGQLKALDPSVVCVLFNPTAENIGLWLLQFIGPELLRDTRAKLVKVEVEETRKCSAVVGD